MDFSLVGCSLDALDADEKVAMKLAFLDAASRNALDALDARDPYDLFVPELAGEGMSVGGRLELESWLTPRPGEVDEGGITPERYRRFLDENGCLQVAVRLREFVRQRVLPLRPLLIGVDHSLTGGALDALAADAPGLALVVLDAHLDALPAAVRASAAAAAAADEVASLPESYNCGTWLAGVIDAGMVAPGDVVVLGVSDHPGAEPREGEPAGMAAYREAYLALAAAGVNVVTKQAMREEGIERCVRRVLQPLAGRDIYLSIDADVGAGEALRAVRFLDTIGLAPEEFLKLGDALAGWLADGDATLAGLDLMEIDVHLADIPGSTDHTVELCGSMLRSLTGGGPHA